MLKHADPQDVPGSEDLLATEQLEQALDRAGAAPFSLVVGGDIMLGGRTKRVIQQHGPDHPFQATLPILRRAAIVLANLEGPLAKRARRQERRFSYRMHPDAASSLKRAGIDVVTLANNHLLDCGAAGVVETLEALRGAGVQPLGAGLNDTLAHEPVIRLAGPWRIGFLGYYWNPRCAAGADAPGCALSAPERIRVDIERLRERVDRIVVTFHWGVPYVRDPSSLARAKARLAVDCGVDAVVGHHPHIVQALEVYRGVPIFYSVGNYAFGSGNSHAEGLLVGFRFEAQRTLVTPYPLYVKNRDPRVDYQPKVLQGPAARRVLERLTEPSLIPAERGWAGLELPRVRPE